MSIDYRELIRTARVYDVARQTPLEPMARLGARLGVDVLLKREDLQPTFAFKVRGSFNRIAQLPPERLVKGVICASAGNHAQGVALAGQRLGIEATIVMPLTTPDIKVSAVANLGGRVVLHGENFDEASVHALTLAEDEGLEFIHPYDDPHVIAGQGTIGVEILAQHPGPIGAIFVPIGGGGLAAGIAAAVKLQRPEVQVIGVEPVDAASMYESLRAGERVTLPQVGQFADGVAVKCPGEEPFRVCREWLDGVVLADTDQICAAIKDVHEETRTLLEPAGALAVAGLKNWIAANGVGTVTGPLVAIASGANMNFDRLRFVADRAEVGENRELLLGVTIDEQPGSYRRLIELLGQRVVTEFNYRYAGGTSAHVLVGLRIARGDTERAEILDALAGHGMAVVDLSADETAKLHIRHMIGGARPDIDDEVLYRCAFPERVGALLRFLTVIGAAYDISLFHYRNHGADYGRVLVGLRVPADERVRAAAMFDALGYEWVEETGNPAYGLFLK